jgi:hypothetical protein
MLVYKSYNIDGETSEGWKKGFLGVGEGLKEMMGKYGGIGCWGYLDGGMLEGG